MKILIINGPNLNLLQKRNPSLYGNKGLKFIQMSLEKLYPEVTFDFFQSNLEGELINKIQVAPDSYDALLINPGGLAHTGIALRDALEICSIPKIEVHFSNIASRENFRKNSITASVCDGYISGFKEFSYIAAIAILLKKYIRIILPK